MTAKRLPTMTTTFFFTAEYKGQEIPFQIRVVREEDRDVMYLVFGHEESPQPWPQRVEDVTICLQPPGYPGIWVMKKDGEPKTHFLVGFSAPHPMIKHEPWQHLEVDIVFEEALETRPQQTQEAQEA